MSTGPEPSLPEPSLPEPSLPGPPAAARMAAAGVVLLVAAVVALLMLRQPREGAVTGICLDAATHQPIPRCRVWLSRTPAGGPSSDDDARADQADAGTVLDLTGAPAGWQQGARDDRDLDAAGVAPRPRDYLEVRTDGQGRFLFTHVPVGTWQVGARSGAYTEAETGTVVEEERTAHITLRLDRAPAAISFEVSQPYWTPGSSPVLGLRGLLPHRRVRLTLQRLKLDAALQQSPDSVLPGASTPDDSSAGDDLYLPVRTWTEPIARADDSGSFYQRVTPGPLPAGVYRLEAAGPGADHAAYSEGSFVVTQLALIRKSYGTGVLAFVTALDSGEALPRVSTALYTLGKDSRLLSQAPTSPGGLARLTTAGAPEEAGGVVVARQGESVAAVRVELNSPGENGASADENSDSEDTGPEDSDSEDGDAGGDSGAGVPSSAIGRMLRSFVYTDRPVYRPGQVVYLKGINRWFSRSAGFGIPADAPVSLDVRDAQETLVYHADLHTNSIGSWSTSLSLSPEALTGEYAVHAVVAGRSSSGSFMVAAYHKPEYQVTVTFSKSRYIRGDTIDALVTGAYYFGAPVTGVRVHCTVTREAWYGGADEEDTADNGPSSDSEGGDSGQGAGEPLIDRTVTLDSTGRAHLLIPTGGSDSNAAGSSTAVGSAGSSGSGVDQEYTVDATAQETSSNPVEATGRVIVGQGEFSLNVAASPQFCAPGTPVRVQIQAMKDSSAPQPGQDLQVQANYELWSESGVETFSPLETQSVQTNGPGAARAIFTPAKSGLLLVRVSGKDSRGNTVTAEDSVWIADQDSDLPARYPDLSVVLDRKHYTVGDTARLLINVEHPGETALVTVEGGTLYRAWPVPLRRKSTAFTLKVRKSFAPNVTVSVCAIRDRQFLQSQSQLVINEPGRQLQIAIGTDRPRYHPGDLATITVRTTAGGRPVPAEVSVGVVDESIYAIQPDTSGDIVQALLPRQSNRVDTDSSCDRVYVGDVDKGASSITIRKVFPDTALWDPVVDTDADGTAVLHLHLPDTLTTWRITAFGISRDSAAGKATQKFVVDKDLVVRLEAPVFLTAGDRSTLTALIHNNTAGPVEASVHLSAPGLGVNGSTSQTVTVRPGAPARLDWSVRTRTAVAVPVTLTARAGGLSDGLQITVPVGPHGYSRESWQSGTLLFRVSKQVTVDPAALPGLTSLQVRLSPSASATLFPAVTYLQQYPYGSTDSTASILSGDVAASRFLGKRPAVAGVRRADLDEMIRRSLLRLYRFQRDEGGWGWFTANGTTDFWMSADATWALELARDAGYPVSDKVLSAGVEAVGRLSDEERSGAPRVADVRALALAALVLAKGGSSEAAENNLNYLQARWQAAPETQQRTDLAAAAMAAHEVGDETLSRALMDSLWLGAEKAGSLIWWPERIPGFAGPQNNRMPDPEAAAWVLLAADTVSPSDPRADGVARWLVANRTGDHWRDTDLTAVVLLGLASYTARSHELQPDFDGEVICNGAVVWSGHFGSESLERPDVVITVPGAALHPGRNQVELRKQGPGRLYYALALRQCLPAAPSQSPAPWWAHLIQRVLRTKPPAPPFSPSGYHLRRVYLRTTSRRSFLWEDSVPARDTHLNAGEDLLVRLIIDGIRPSSHVMIEEPVPAGCAITEIGGDAAADWSHWWDYTDVRDDRLVFFIGDMDRGEYEIDYHLQARTPGTYDVMPSQLTGVFDPTLHATGKTDRIVIDGVAP